MSALQKVTEQDFEQVVLRQQLPVLTEFGATWCGPCKTVAPELQALSQELEGRALIVEIDVDESPRIAQALRIQSVPTFIVFVAGKPVDATQGVQKKEQLAALLEKHLPRMPGALSPREAFALVEKQRLIPVDTRPTAVFDRAHLAGAQSFPIETIREQVADLIALSAPALLYCRDGKLTKTLASELASQGTPVAYLEGGVLGWEAEGYHLQRPS